MSNCIVRTAEMSDLAEIIKMGREMHSTCNFSHLQFDPRHFGEFVVNLIAGENHEVFLAESDGNVTGALLCSTCPSMISPDLVAYEHAFFVRPAHRSLGAALKLLRAYREWAVAQGARRINAGNSAGMPDEGYVKLLSREGFTRAGSLMYLNA